MLELTRIRENKDQIAEALKVRNLDAQNDLSEIISLDEKRRATQHQMDTELQELNSLSKQIGELFKSGKGAEANEPRLYVQPSSNSSFWIRDKYNC